MAEDKSDDDGQHGERVSEALRASVRDIAVAALPPSRRATSNVYMDQRKLRRGARLGPSFESWYVERESVLCFVDHEPQANFSHSCSYFLHDPESGELLERVPARFTPFPTKGIHLLDLLYEGVSPKEAIRRRATGGGKLEPRMKRMLQAAPSGGRRYAISTLR